MPSRLVSSDINWSLVPSDDSSAWGARLNNVSLAQTPASRGCNLGLTEYFEGFAVFRLEPVLELRPGQAGGAQVETPQLATKVAFEMDLNGPNEERQCQRPCSPLGAFWTGSPEDDDPPLGQWVVRKLTRSSPMKDLTRRHKLFGRKIFKSVGPLSGIQDQECKTYAHLSCGYSAGIVRENIMIL
jgi:hypothetical protein